MSDKNIEGQIIGSVVNIWSRPWPVVMSGEYVLPFRVAGCPHPHLCRRLGAGGACPRWPRDASGGVRSGTWHVGHWSLAIVVRREAVKIPQRFPRGPELVSSGDPRRRTGQVAAQRASSINQYITDR